MLFCCGFVVVKTYRKMFYSGYLLSRKVVIEIFRDFASTDIVALFYSKVFCILRVLCFCLAGFDKARLL